MPGRDARCAKAPGGSGRHATSGKWQGTWLGIWLGTWLVGDGTSPVIGSLVPIAWTAGLVFAFALLAGVIAQAIGRHATVPGIIFLLGTGIALGPDGLDLIDPQILGGALDTIVGFAVAVILFEGGMRLEVAQLRKQKTVIRRLVVYGAVLTTGGGALAARLILGWDWRTALLFGTLVIVTGPTVISPLVRRIRLAPSLAVVLEAEGVFVDAIGATIAIVALELALGSPSDPLGTAVLGMLTRLATGAAIGSCGGLLLGTALRVRKLVPRGMENILALSAAIAVYQLSQAIVPESGITASIAAGLVVGNLRVRRMDELAEFKEQLTTLLIGLLFVLLAADVRMADVAAIGPRAVLVVAALMLVVRPAVVWLASIGAGLAWRERLFISWIGPRGIVAAAVATVFATALDRNGVPGGTELRALVFIVIAMTVTLQGLSAGPLASLLGLRRASNTGYLFLGANPLAIHLAKRFARAGLLVELVDTSTEYAAAAQAAGLKVIYGNGLDPRTLAKARIDSRSHVIAVTASESVNMLFAQQVADETAEPPQLLVAIDPNSTGVAPEMVHKAGATVLFGRGIELDAWLVRLRHKSVELVRRMYVGPVGPRDPFPDHVLPLYRERGGVPRLFDDRTELRDGDLVELVLATEAREAIDAWFATQPWQDVVEARHEPVLARPGHATAETPKAA
ncbi:MAG: cation:proton antiporter [Kofleriaceae bacterium]